MPSRPRRSVLLAASVLVTALAVAPPASAEIVRVDDGADTPDSLNDILKVRVVHGEDNVVVRTTFPNLKKKADASLTVFIDTKRRPRGPEFGVGLPLFSGGDYVLVPMRKWRFVGEPVECSYGGKFAWADDYVKLRFDRACFDDPKKIRVGMKMRDNFDGHQITDWLIGRREWTELVASG